MDTDRLKEVSSLYGPGAVGAWLLTLVSVIISWMLNPRTARKDTITNDYVAALILPAVASFHLLHELKYWRPPSLPTIPLDSETSRASANIEACLAVCETFRILTHFLGWVAAFRGQRKRTIFVVLVTLLSLAAEIVLSARVFINLFTSLIWSRFLLLKFVGRVILICAILTTVLIVSGFSLLDRLKPPPSSTLNNYEYQGSLRVAVSKMEAPRSSRKRLAMYKICAWTSFFFTMDLLILGNSYTNSGQFSRGILFFTRRTSASISDLDQTVTLGAGALTLIFSILAAVKSAKVAEEIGLGELDAGAFGSDERVVEAEEDADMEMVLQDMPAVSDLGVQPL